VEREREREKGRRGEGGGRERGGMGGEVSGFVLIDVGVIICLGYYMFGLLYV
jgi:hypothetical protein